MSLGPRRRVSYSQLEALWEALSQNRSLATGYNKTSQARELLRQMWETVALNLNSFGDGATKDWKGWSKYWNDYKSKLKSRVATIRASQQCTGGGPSNEHPLSDIEKKFLQIVGKDFGTGIPDARIEPFDDAPTSPPPPPPPLGHQSQQGSESVLSHWPHSALLSEGEEEQQQPPATPPPESLAVLTPVTPRRSPRLMARRDSPAAIAGPSTRAPQYTPRVLQIGTPPPRQHLTPRPAPTRQRQRQRRGEPPMTQQAARRALVADSLDRTALSREKLEVLKNLVIELRAIKNILSRWLPAASPSDVRIC